MNIFIKILNKFNFGDSFELNFKSEKERKKILKEKAKKLTKLDISEFILDYTYSFSSRYMLYNGMTDFIKSMNYKDRMYYIINSCNTINPSIKEQFLLSLAYNNLGSMYNEYTIRYIEMYLHDYNFYNKQFRGCTTNEDKINYQINMFNILLANKYSEDLEYEKALNCALKAKGMSDSYAKRWEPYYTISTILYKMNDYKNAIINLNEGLRKIDNKYDKKNCIELLKELKDKQKRNYIYKPKKIVRKRIDPQTNKIYDLTTGEIIE